MVLTYVTINNFKNFVLDSNARSDCSDLFGFFDLQKGWHSSMYSGIRFNVQ